MAVLPDSSSWRHASCASAGPASLAPLACVQTEVAAKEPEVQPAPQTQAQTEEAASEVVPAPETGSAAVESTEGAAPAATPAQAPEPAAAGEHAEGDPAVGTVAAAGGAGSAEEDGELVDVPENAHGTISKSKMLDIVKDVVEAAKDLRKDIAQNLESGKITAAMAPMLVQMRIETLDSQIASKFNVTKEEIQEAQAVYEKDASIAPHVKVLQEETQLAMMGGTRPEPTWTEDTMIKNIQRNAQASMEILLEKKRELVASGALGGAGKEQFAQAMMHMLPQVAVEALHRIGVDQAEMQQNMLAYGSNERVMQAVLESSQNMQQDQLAELSEF